MNDRPASQLDRRAFGGRFVAAFAATSIAGFPIIGRSPTTPVPLMLALFKINTHPAMPA
jgi:hypothetical protein